MRISTSQMHDRGVNAMLDQQAKLSKTEVQLATGRRILTPSDDPSGSTQVLDLDRSIATTQQYTRNADQAESRLQLEESVLNSSSEVLNRIRELTVQANNGTQTNESRSSIAQELRQLEEELLALGNSRDSNGEYLFAGNATDTQPFVRNADGSVAYQGDQGQRHLQIGAANQVAVGDSGSDVFMAVPEGNGTFVVKPDAGNTGSGVVGAGSVSDYNQWTGHDYTVSFAENTDGELVYTVYDDTDGVWVEPASGAVDDAPLFESGYSIGFDGISFDVTGTPEPGDALAVAPSGNQSIFSTLNELIEAVESPVANSTDSAELHNTVGRALSNIDQAEGSINDTRAKIGGRLNDIDRQRYTNDDHVLHLETIRSDIADLDYAEATARFAQEETALQAAQQAYIKVKDLSLFNYL